MREIDAALRSLVEDMCATMYDAPGIGLAATQLGVMKQVFVMDAGGKDDPPEPMALINPEILWASDEEGRERRGLSLDPRRLRGRQPRPPACASRWTDLDGIRQEQEFGDRWAICAQHEIDHLRGRLFIDYLGAVKRTLITARMKKLKREKARA